MHILKSVIVAGIALGMVSLPTLASAQNYHANSAIVHQQSIHDLGPLDTPFAIMNNSNRNFSETAGFYFKVGVNNFERGELDKAEQAFKAVLRANGLNKQAHYYLALLNIEKERLDIAATHVKKFHKLR